MSARMRLICFPYAGGSAATYRDLPALLPEVEVLSPELPGRGSRLSEPAMHDMAALVDVLLDELDGSFTRPFALFGHSMGAAIAFELALRLPLPVQANLRHLFVSGRIAPGEPQLAQRLQHLDDRAFIDALRKLGGTPAPVLDSFELMTLLTPVLRADFTLIENHRPSLGRRLAVDITAFTGHADERVPVESVMRWGATTTGSFDFNVIEGDHFFLKSKMPALAGLIEARLRRAERVSLSAI
jgi:surfactin synthase thioesterase subunit